MDKCVQCNKKVENLYDEKGWIHLASLHETPMLLEVTNGRSVPLPHKNVGDAKFRYIHSELEELKLCSKECLFQYLNLEDTKVEMRSLSDIEAQSIFGYEIVKDFKNKELCIIPIETKIINLANKYMGTFCGVVDNKCFVKIAKHYSDRKVYGWYDEECNCMYGTILIQCNQAEAREISDLARHADGSLEDYGKSENLKGFFQFEIE